MNVQSLFPMSSTSDHQDHLLDINWPFKDPSSEENSTDLKSSVQEDLNSKSFPPVSSLHSLPFQDFFEA